MKDVPSPSTPLKTFAQLRHLLQPLAPPNESARNAAKAYQDSIIKPQNALGRLQDIVAFFAAWQDRMKPTLQHPHMSIFVGNHGIMNRSRAADAPSFTQQMVRSIRNGKAAISVLCRLHDVPMDIVPLVLTRPTKDFTTQPAMSEADCMQAIAKGMACVPADCDVLMLGDMGVGHTTAATAVASALLRRSPHLLVSLGSETSKAQLQEKAQLIWQGLQTHKRSLDDPLQILCALGGRELAACVGAMLGARQRMIPVILDGLTPSVAALILFMLHRDLTAHCLAGHRCDDTTQQASLEKLGLDPLLDLRMHLGEGVGAVLAYRLVQASLRMHHDMAPVAQARVGCNLS